MVLNVTKISQKMKKKKNELVEYRKKYYDYDYKKAVRKNLEKFPSS